MPVNAKPLRISSVAQLHEYADVPMGQIENVPVAKLLEAANELLKAGENEMIKGHLDLAYIFYYRHINIAFQLKKRGSPERLKQLTSRHFEAKFLQICMDRLEELKTRIDAELKTQKGSGDTWRSNSSVETTVKDPVVRKFLLVEEPKSLDKDFAEMDDLDWDKLLPSTNDLADPGDSDTENVPPPKKVSGINGRSSSSKKNSLSSGDQKDKKINNVSPKKVYDAKNSSTTGNIIEEKAAGDALMEVLARAEAEKNKTIGRRLLEPKKALEFMEQKKNILLFDIRQPNHYQESRIVWDSTLNISRLILAPGMTLKLLTSVLREEELSVFSNLNKYECMVIVDYDSSCYDAINNELKPANVLYDALVKEKGNVGRVYHLDGGFNGMLTKFPNSLTNGTIGPQNNPQSGPGTKVSRDDLSGLLDKLTGLQELNVNKNVPPVVQKDVPQAAPEVLPPKPPSVQRNNKPNILCKPQPKKSPLPSQSVDVISTLDQVLAPPKGPPLPPPTPPVTKTTRSALVTNPAVRELAMFSNFSKQCDQIDKKLVNVQNEIKSATKENLPVLEKNMEVLRMERNRLRQGMTDLPDKVNYQMSRSLRRVFWELFMPPENIHEGINIRPYFWETFTNLRKAFRNTKQHDSHEFLLALLSIIHDEVNMGNTKLEMIKLEDFRTPLEQYRAFVENDLRRNHSIITDLFQGMFVSSVTCQRCKYRSICPQTFLCLDLPSIETPSAEVHLSTCIEEFLRPDMLSEWKCDKCKSSGEAKRSVAFTRFPKILILHLGFGQYNYDAKKSRTRVNFPMNEPCDFDEFLSSEFEPRRNEMPYRLIGFVSHSGNLHSGHYTATCRLEPNGSWMRYNDEHVDFSETALKNDMAGAFLLFYMNIRSNYQFKKSS